MKSPASVVKQGFLFNLLKLSNGEMEIKVLKAGPGDAILIQYRGYDDLNHNILIDGGSTGEYKKFLHNELERIFTKKEELDLLVVTHRDNDHILGVVELFSDERLRSLVKKVWFNSNLLISKMLGKEHKEEDEVPLVISKSNEPNLGFKSAKTLEKHLLENKIEWHSSPITAGYTENIYGLEINVLSPDRRALQVLNEKDEAKLGACIPDYGKGVAELLSRTNERDNSLSNKTSLAFRVTLQGLNYLLLGDAPPDIVVQSLRNLGYSASNKITFEFVKLSHHASNKSLSDELLEIMNCNKYIISTNGKRDCLPNKASLSRILGNPNRALSDHITFFFNYPISDNIFSEDEKVEFNFSCVESRLGENGLILI